MDWLLLGQSPASVKIFTGPNVPSLLFFRLDAQTSWHQFLAAAGAASAAYGWGVNQIKISF
jgi:hypothetical protein